MTTAEEPHPAFDRRLTPARPDLAAARLEGVYLARRYAHPTRKIMTAPFAALTPRPDVGAPLDSMLLHGEAFDAYEDKDGWIWGQCETDGYVGYAPSAAFMPADEVPPATHKITALMTHLYPAPDLKAYPVGGLQMLSRVAMTGEKEGAFCEMDGGLWIPSQHIAPLDAFADDFVAVAEAFRGAPYLWGGRTAAGVDCSGLIQIALAAAGVGAPRDSDLQETTLGTAVDFADDLRRGDLIFWKGHVGVLTNSRSLLHANAHHMAVGEESLRMAVKRIRAAGGGEPRQVRRLAKLSAV